MTFILCLAVGLCGVSSADAARGKKRKAKANNSASRSAKRSRPRRPSGPPLHVLQRQYRVARGSIHLVTRELERIRESLSEAAIELDAAVAESQRIIQSHPVILSDREREADALREVERARSSALSALQAAPAHAADVRDLRQIRRELDELKSRHHDKLRRSLSLSSEERKALIASASALLSVEKRVEDRTDERLGRDERYQTAVRELEVVERELKASLADTIELCEGAAGVPEARREVQDLLARERDALRRLSAHHQSASILASRIAARRK